MHFLENVKNVKKNVKWCTQNVLTVQNMHIQRWSVNFYCIIVFYCIIIYLHWMVNDCSHNITFTTIITIITTLLTFSFLQCATLCPLHRPTEINTVPLRGTVVPLQLDGWIYQMIGFADFHLGPDWLIPTLATCGYSLFPQSLKISTSKSPHESIKMCLVFMFYPVLWVLEAHLARPLWPAAMILAWAPPPAQSQLSAPRPHIC